MKHIQLQELIGKLKEKSRNENANLWKRIATELEKSTRRRRIVNLFKIAKTTGQDELVIVPGKVLASGDITNKVRIAAYQFSQSALDKIKKVEGEAITFDELLGTDIKGQKVRIIG